MQIFGVEFQFGCVSIVGLRVHEITSDAKWNENKSNKIAKYAMPMKYFKLHSILSVQCTDAHIWYVN